MFGNNLPEWQPHKKVSSNNKILQLQFILVQSIAGIIHKIIIYNIFLIYKI